MRVPDRLDDVCRVVERYPEFWELYEEVFRFRFQKEELISMYSDALRILDENTVQYMVEEQKEEIEVLKKGLAEKERQMEEKERQMEEQQRSIEEQQREIEHLRRLLEARE